MNLQLLTQWALTSALLILAVLAVRFFTRGRLSFVNHYALWAVVLVRLLLPFQLPFLPSPGANAADLVPTMPGILERPLTPDTAVGYASISPDHFENSGFHIQEDGTVLSEEPSWYPVLDQETGSIKAYFGGFTVEDTILAVWGWGAVLAGGVILLSNLCFWLRLTWSRRKISIQNVNFRIYTTNCIPSPCLFGLFRTTIYLTPETVEDEQTLRHVLTHELTHYAHRDHIWSLLRCAALALHWYNPGKENHPAAGGLAGEEARDQENRPLRRPGGGGPGGGVHFRGGRGGGDPRPRLCGLPPSGGLGPVHPLQPAPLFQPGLPGSHHR